MKSRASKVHENIYAFLAFPPSPGAHKAECSQPQNVEGEDTPLGK